MLSVSPSGFPHQVRNIGIEKQINIPSERKLNPNCRFWSPPLGSQHFMFPLFLNTKFIKRESKLEFSYMR